MEKEQLCSKMVFGQLGVLSKINKIQQNWLLYYSACKKPQQWSLYEVIRDILPFVLNTKWPLSDIWLLSYEPNSFGCFLNKLKFWIFHFSQIFNKNVEFQHIGPYRFCWANWSQKWGQKVCKSGSKITKMVQIAAGNPKNLAKIMQISSKLEKEPN